MTPSRKPSRATVITASVAIGVFGAGAGLGTVVAIRASPIEGQVIRLAAGTYHLDDRAGAWTSQAAADGDQPLPLSGSDAGSTITSSSNEQRVCLTATIDGHAVGAGGSGCVALPVLAVAAAAARPGNPKSTPSPPPPPKAPANPSKPKPTAPAPKAPVQPSAANPAPRTPVQPPAPPTTRPKPPAAPTPTQKITGNISENGSVVKRSEEGNKERQQLITPTKQPPSDEREAKPSNTAGPLRPSNTAGPLRPSITVGPAQPSDTLKPALPSSTVKPTVPPSAGEPTALRRIVKPTVLPGPSGAAKPTRPSGALRPALPSTLPHPPDTSSRRIQPNLPPAEPSQDAEPPSTDPGNDQNAPQVPDGTVLLPAPQPLPEGSAPEGDAQLPVFRDPELLQQAREALGLDRGMRYTDENGVWDLNIAPPGTPPCRNYSLEEFQALSASPSGSSTAQAEPSTAQASPTIPRDSCLWPAFIRWLYAEPTPGQVSNWTKFTGLPKRNLELVLTNPAPASPVQPDQSDSVQPEPGQVEPDSSRLVQPNSNQPGQPGQPNQPDSNQPNQPNQPGQPNQPDSNQPDQFDRPRHSGQPGRLDPVQPGPGHIEPDPNEYTGP
jgi:hypothetical protein